MEKDEFCLRSCEYKDYCCLESDSIALKFQIDALYGILAASAPGPGHESQGHAVDSIRAQMSF